MARFVMLLIEDNQTADDFVASVNRGDLIIGRPIESEGAELRYGPMPDASVEAVWAVPTKFCDCTDYNGISVKSKKYGWWVHSKCGKPRPTALQHPTNLLEANLSPTERKYYIGFRANREPWNKPRS